MWYVKVFGCTNTQPRVYHRESLDGVRWSGEREVSIKMPENEVLWHIDVEKLSDGNYLMVIAAYPQSANCGKTNRLYLAFSSDGLKWTVYKEPLLITGEEDSWDSGGLYRSTFTIEKGRMHLWYTGLRDGVWKIGYTCSEIPLFEEEIYSLNVIEAKQ